MSYQTQLDFLTRFYRKCNLQLLRHDPQMPMDPSIDYRFRESLGRNNEYFSTIGQTISTVRSHTIYRVMDQYLCVYLFLSYRDEDRPVVLSIGPYLPKAMTPEEIAIHAEKVALTPQQLRNYYSGLPVLEKEHPVFSALYTFCEEIWDKSTVYQMEDLNLTLTGNPPPPDSKHPMTPAELTSFKQMVELRYAYENELMNAVSSGITLKAELQHPSAFPSFLDPRSADPVRNIKNYCIILNTLMRKAAENGGVHPIHVDALSSMFASRIEAVTGTEEGKNMMDEMFLSYCRLVKKHSVRNCSALIQQAIVCIDADLEGDLSLNTLAGKLNVNSSYLSTLFKKEMGQTITDHITSKRITLAMKLLGTTKLQIQTIAQKCGIPDVNYFTKKFKKATGRTPKEYRQALETMLTPHGSNL